MAMQKRANNKRYLKASCGGFTLIEVVFAIVMLSTSLVVIISLQTSTIQKALRDRNQQQAMLAMRTIMSAVELNISTVVQGFQGYQGTAIDLLKKVMPQAGQLDSDEVAALQKFEADMTTEIVFIPVPGKQEPVTMKRVNVALRWGDTPDDKLQVVLFVPASIEGGN
jgi:type II secretory pathway pseudopilin PulG